MNTGAVRVDRVCLHPSMKWLMCSAPVKWVSSQLALKISPTPKWVTRSPMKHRARLPCLKPSVPMVFCSFPTDMGDYEELRESLGKLKLNDLAALTRTEPSLAWVSAAAWAYCTWKSFRSVWAVNLIWTSSPPRRAWCTTSIKPIRRWRSCITLSTCQTRVD